MCEGNGGHFWLWSMNFFSLKCTTIWWTRWKLEQISSVMLECTHPAIAQLAHTYIHTYICTAGTLLQCVCTCTYGIINKFLCILQPNILISRSALCLYVSESIHCFACYLLELALSYIVWIASHRNIHIFLSDLHQHFTSYSGTPILMFPHSNFPTFYAVVSSPFFQCYISLGFLWISIH
jgi:hypothetical protein